MSLSDEQIKKIYQAAKYDQRSSVMLIEKSRFECYIFSLWEKAVKVKTAEGEKNLQIIEWIKAWYERQTYFNTINIVQSEMLLVYERQIAKLEFENEQLLTENQKLKENI